MNKTTASNSAEKYPRITDEEAAELSGGVDPWSSTITMAEREKIKQLCVDVPGYFFWLIKKGAEKKPIYNTAWKFRKPQLNRSVSGGVQSVDMTEGNFNQVLLDYLYTDDKSLAKFGLTLRAWFYESGQLAILATRDNSDSPSIKLVVDTIPAVIERHGAKLVKTDFEPAVLAALFDLQYKEQA